MENKCDVCRKDAKVEAVTITLRGKTAVTDVCSSCIELATTLFDAGSTSPRNRTARKAIKPQGHAVIPIA